jgi:hypothetical protein
MGPEAFDGSDDTERRMFNKSGVGVAKNSANDRKNVFDHVVVVNADITATVGGSLESGSLDICGEEVKEVEERCQATFTYDGTWIFF